MEKEDVLTVSLSPFFFFFLCRDMPRNPQTDQSPRSRGDGSLCEQSTAAGDRKHAAARYNYELRLRWNSVNIQI